MERCDRRGPLKRSGTTQAGRDLAELSGDHFHIDERGLPDFALYAEALAREILWHDQTNQPAGDWTPFFASDVTATLARLARLPVDPFRRALADAEAWLRADRTRPAAALRPAFNLVFHLPVALLGALAEGHARLARDHPLRARLGRLLGEDIAAPLAALVGWHKGAIGADLPLGEVPPDLEPADFGDAGSDDGRLRLSATVAARAYGPATLADRPIAVATAEALGAADWAGFCAAVEPNPAPYAEASGANLTYEQIHDALNYNLLSAAIERVFEGLQRARGLAAEALERSLTEVDDHAPHYGLFLAFLDMLERARDGLNRMTGRHLDFYYTEVLGLAPRPPVPAQAHLLFTPAKGVDALLKPAGTGFLAGKDATGRPVRFRLADDLVVNRATVAGLTAVRLARRDTPDGPAETLHATDVAALAETAQAEGAGWPAFGPAPWPEGAGTPAAPFARIGFAVADRKLLLTEGERRVFLVIAPEEPLATAAMPKLAVRLTGEDGCFVVAGAAKMSGAGLEVSFGLDGDAPAVVPFAAELHGAEMGTVHAPDLPVAEILFDFRDPDDATARAFAAWRTARVTAIDLRAEATGLRNLKCHTPTGAADPAQPFAPFGPRPRKGDAFLIGCPELFAKPVTTASLRLEWQTRHGTTGFFRKLAPSSYRADVSYLVKGDWKRASGNGPSLGLDASTTASVPLPQTALAAGSGPILRDPRPYRPDAATGFLRLELSEDFGHQAFAAELTRANVRMARGEALTPKSAYNYDGGATTGGTPVGPGPGSMQAAPAAVSQPGLGGLGMTLAAIAPDEPLTPKPPYEAILKSIALDYGTPSGPPERFLHVTPFGHEERPAATGALLPDIPFEAALHVALAGLAPPARLTLLAQVDNGTGDPLMDVPDLRFEYLSESGWTGFETAAIDDKTENFAASAVIGLAVPKAATTTSARMPQGTHWLRLSVPENAAALNRLRRLAAQAGRVVFAEAGNDPAYLASPTPADTITRLAQPDARLNAVAQPFASFGGAPREDAAAFRRRASERLRHKDRAATLWDYERLALAAAPELYLVKCLPHSELLRDPDGGIIDDELRPGGVVVVTVPWTRGRLHLDPLRPFTDQATLKKVRDALRPRLSPFVRLEVANPRFEEVRVTFKVAFRPGIADTAFYRDELNRGVIGFLAPWSVPAGAGAEIAFGGRLRKSAVINFVEEQPYVDYLEKVRLHHRRDPGAPWAPADMEVVEASTARSILVSAAGHGITELA